MKYILKLKLQQSSSSVVINSERFEKLKTSKAILAEALFIEQEYEILLTNYLELEKQAINITLNKIVKNNDVHMGLYEDQLELNRCLSNLLSSAKLYLDHLSSHLQKCIPEDENIKDKIKVIISSKYDGKFEYRFMEALRNYVQHKNTPIHAYSTQARRDTTSGEKLEFSSYFAALKVNVTKDGAFKASVRDEMPNEVNLLEATRIYLECLSEIHFEVRELVKDSTNKARIDIGTAIGEYKLVNESKYKGLYALQLDGENLEDDIVDETPITLEWDEVRVKLHARNRRLSNLSKTYVSSRPNKINMDSGFI